MRKAAIWAIMSLTGGTRAASCTGELASACYDPDSGTALAAVSALRSMPGMLYPHLTAFYGI